MRRLNRATRLHLTERTEMMKNFRFAVSVSCSAVLALALGLHFACSRAGDSNHQVKNGSAAVVNVCTPCDMPDALVAPGSPVLPAPAVLAPIATDRDSVFRTRLQDPSQHNRAPPLL